MQPRIEERTTKALLIPDCSAALVTAGKFPGPGAPRFANWPRRGWAGDALPHNSGFLGCLAVLVLGLGTATFPYPSGAAIIDKADNTIALNLGPSWIGGVSPSSADTAQWSSTVTAANTLLLGAEANWLGVKVSNPRGTVTINGGNTLTLGSGGVDLASATANLALNCSLTLGANQEWNIAPGRKLTIGGGVSGGSVELTKSGGGEAQLSVANSFSGSVVVGAGKLTVAHQRALGFAGAAVLSGAELQVGTPSGTFTNALTLAGHGGINDSVGALHFTGGTVTWSGPLALTNGASIGSYAGSGNYTLSGGITGFGNVTFWAGGASQSHTHIYTVSAPCTYEGDTLLDTWAANAVVVLSGGPNRLPTNGVLTLMAGIWGVSPPQVLSAVLKLNGSSQTFGGLVSGGGSMGIGGTNRVVNGSATAATLTINNENNNLYDGFLGGPGANENNFGLTKNGAGNLVVERASTYTGATVVNGGTLSVKGGLGGGAATVASGASLFLGSGLYTLSRLTLKSSSLLGVNLGGTGNPSNTVLQVNGDLVLDGTILVQDLGGSAVGNICTVINYTGTLTDLGMTTAPGSQWDVQVDTSTPKQVRLHLLQYHPVAECTNSNFAVTTTSTNLGVAVHGFPTRPFWYEVRDSANRLWDYGSTLPTSPWSITVRHLRPGTNTVTIFAQDAGGNVGSNSIQLTMILDANSPIRPRPQPAEIWWGGTCHDLLFNSNGSVAGSYSRFEQLTNTVGWDFVKQFQDGLFLPGPVWVFHEWPMTNWVEVGRAISSQLAPYNCKYWLDDYYYPTTNDVNFGRSWAVTEATVADDLQRVGLVLSEMTEDVNEGDSVMIKVPCYLHPTWPQSELLALSTGDTNGVSPNYPYSSGEWRDFASGLHSLRPNLKIGWVYSPVWFSWSNEPALYSDMLAFTINVGGTNYSFQFDFADFMAAGTLVGEQVGVPFAFSSDCPWDYYGDPGGNRPAMQPGNRQKIRDYEAWLQDRKLRHTQICNYSQLNMANPDASDLAYKNSSLNTMFLHQQEGGRAARYLFESWYQGPFTVLPETKNGSYANLAMDAIKYLKGFRDTNGTLERLTLTLLSGGTSSVIEMRNDGDIQCLPVLQAFENGNSGGTIQYYDRVGKDISAAVLSPQGYAVKTFLQPGQSTTFTVVRQDASQPLCLEAFWNPQDPTGIVRDRLALGPPVISTQPSSRTNLVGTTTVFTVGVSGAAPLIYQWQKDGLVLTDGGNLSGTDSGTLVVADLQMSDEGNYRVVIANGEGSTTSSNANLKVVDTLNTAPVLPGQTNRVIAEQTSLRVTNTASDIDIPADTLTYELLDAPAGASIDTNGLITWTPTEAQGPSTNTFITVVTDNGIPPLSATNRFIVVVTEANLAPVLPTFISSTTPPSLIHRYSFDGDANDSVGTANGVLRGGATVSGGQLILDGLSAYVDLPNNLVTGLTSITLETWVMDSGSGGWARIYDFGNSTAGEDQPGGGTKYMFLSLPAGTGNLRGAYSLTGGGTGEQVMEWTGHRPPVGQQAHIVWVSDGATHSGRLYVNGVLVGSNPNMTLTPAALGSTVNNWLGRSQFLNDPLFKGSMAEFRIYSAALSAVDVQSHFQWGPNAIASSTLMTLSVNKQSTLTFTNSATDLDLPHNTLTYSLLAAPSGATIDTNGIITWTPATAQGPSTNLITTVVTDNGAPPLSATNSFIVVVNEGNRAPVLPAQSSRTIAEQTLLTVTNTAADPDVPATALSYQLLNAPAGVLIDTHGVITWTPTEAQGPGTNTVMTVVTDDGSPRLSATNAFTVIVNEVNTAPVLDVIPNREVNPGQTINFSAKASDQDQPTNKLAFDLVSPPLGATLDPDSGAFNWRPGVALANTTNVLQVRVRDDGVPVLSDLRTFTVVVGPIGPVVLTPVSFTEGHFRFGVSGPAGPDYITLASTNLTEWMEVFTNLSPVPPFQFDDSAAGNFPGRTYRVRLRP